MLSTRKNPRIRELLQLRGASRRRRGGRMVVDGVTEILRAIEGGCALETIFSREPGPEDFRWVEVLERARSMGVRIEWITPRLATEIGYGQSVASAVAVAREPVQDLADLVLEENPGCLVLVDVEKPGNAGAVIRSAAAAGFSALFATGTGTDPYHANVIRASRGLCFHLPCFCADAGEVLGFLRKRKIPIYAALSEGEQSFWDTDLRGACAIVLGAEDRGLDSDWRDAADHSLQIPMAAGVDSLNVSISAALIAYERMRQLRKPLVEGTKRV